MSLSLFPEINSDTLALLDVVQGAPAAVAVHLLPNGTETQTALCGKTLNASARAASLRVVNMDHGIVCPLCRRAALILDVYHGVRDSGGGA